MLAIVVALLALGAGDAPEPFQFDDPVGDATTGNAIATNEAAAATDVLNAGVREQDGKLEFWMELDDLESIHADDAAPDYHVQYALTFTTADGTYSMRATYQGDDRRTVPEILHDGWAYNIHHHDPDTWPAADGRLEDNTILWSVDPSEIDLDLGQLMDAWSIQTWAAYDDREQVGDRANSFGGYVLGEGSWLPEPEPVPEMPNGIGLIADDRQDVTSRGDAYSGPDAPTVDVVSFAAADGPDGLHGALMLADLSGISDYDGETGYHVQYAVNFASPSGDVYSLRATYRGPEMRAGQTAWNFQLHDQSTDEWPEIYGRIEGESILWVMPHALAGIQVGDVLTDWSVSTWASYDDAEQRNDWANSAHTYTVGAKPVPEAEQADEPESFEDIPGLGLAPLLGLLYVAGRRRK